MELEVTLTIIQIPQNPQQKKEKYFIQTIVMPTFTLTLPKKARKKV